MNLVIFAFREYKRRYKKLYLIPISILMLITITFYIFANYSNIKTLSDISLSIFGSFVASFFIHLTIELNSIYNNKFGVRTIDSIYRGDFFNKAVQQSENLKWHFKGGTGSWVRSYVLSQLKEQAKKKDQHFEIIVQIINPFDINLCKSYVEYKKSFKGVGAGSLSDHTSVQRDLLATVLILLIEELQNKNFKTEIYYQNYFSDFRIDLSFNFALMSRDDNKEILAIPRDNPLYLGFENDFKRSSPLAIRQSKINISPSPARLIDNSFVETLLKEVYKSNNQTFNLLPAEVEIITQKVTKRENRYSI